MTGHTKLTHKKNIQGNVKCLCHLKGYNHTATRETKYLHILAISILCELCSQHSPRVGSILKSFYHLSPLNSHPSLREVQIFSLSSQWLSISTYKMYTYYPTNERLQRRQPSSFISSHFHQHLQDTWPSCIFKCLQSLI